MSSKKILLCDDDERITHTLEGFFLAKGYDMVTSFTGEDAIRKVSSDKPDLVIMDLKLPGMNGAEVSKKIKEMEPDTKIIVLSGFKEEYSEELAKVPVDHVMEKPVNMRELTQTISDMLAGRAPAGKDKVPGTPKARLLMLEPKPETAARIKEFFSDQTSSGGEYEIEISSDSADLMEKIKSFSPDILLISVSDEHSGKLVSDLMKGDEREVPHMIISAGLESHKIAKKVKEMCHEKGMVK
jgi:two-component system, response regulator, stage 0 sporulation protein F